MKAMLARPIQLADEVAKQCAAARSFRAECAELKARADKLAALLRQAARAPRTPREPGARLKAGGRAERSAGAPWRRRGDDDIIHGSSRRYLLKRKHVLIKVNMLGSEHMVGDGIVAPVAFGVRGVA